MPTPPNPPTPPTASAWIARIEFADAIGKLAKLYARIKGPGDVVDNIMMAHSLRPHTMEGHMALYKSVLHHAHNRLPPALLESAGVYASMLNGCAYCVEHHLAGLGRLFGDPARLEDVRSALERDRPEDAFDGRDLAVLRYTRALTLHPADVTEEHLEAMRAEGMDDGEILEANQVAAYFAYANRTVQGLGVTTEGDILGTSPNRAEDPDDWQHR